MRPETAHGRLSGPLPAASGESPGALAIARVASGEETALRELYELFGRRVLAIAWDVVGEQAEAEDVVQQTFVEVWRRAPEFDPRRGSPVAWIATIAKSRALNRVRARTSQERRVRRAASEPVESLSEGPEAALERGQQKSRLHALLEHLEPEREQVVRLAYFEGLTHTQIAAHTGQPVGTVKTRLRLAIARLTELFLPADGGGA